MLRFLLPPTALMFAVGLAACQQAESPQSTSQPAAATSSAPPAAASSQASSYAEAHLADYAAVTLDADLSALDADQRRMLALLIDAAKVMDALFWQQSWGDRASLMQRARNDAERRFLAINVGPWDRLNNDAPILPGIDPRPPGARFYPDNMSREEFAAANLADKTSLYTLLRRDSKGALYTIPYHEAYKEQLARAADLLRQAARLAKNQGFRTYLELRADALLSDEYQASDLAWMEMRDNPVGLVIGPIETYEDRLFGYKASYEAYVLLKDKEWSRKLARFAAFLPELQAELPVPEAYKSETPGTDADLNAYFALYYGGAANAGAKTIAINLPNDEEVQLKKGTRRLQLENAMQAKFDEIMLPIADVLIAADQRQNVTFNAFFENTMFHEVAHGLGIKNTLAGDGTVRKALKDTASAFEEGKADVLGVYMIEQLTERGELQPAQLMDNYVTFLAGMLRSVRFGASDSHAIANMVRFNFFLDRGAFARDPDSGTYLVHRDKMHQAIEELSRRILTIQGDGDYARAGKLIEELGYIRPQLAADLERLGQASIPVDIVFRQGAEVLGTL